MTLHILGFRIQNYGPFKDITLGQLPSKTACKKEPLSRFNVLIGKNGSGKGSVLDALSFLGDCLRHGVEAPMNRRLKWGATRFAHCLLGDIDRPLAERASFDVYFRVGKSQPASYNLVIGLDKKGIIRATEKGGLAPAVRDKMPARDSFFLRAVSPAQVDSLQYAPQESIDELVKKMPIEIQGEVKVAKAGQLSGGTLNLLAHFFIMHKKRPPTDRPPAILIDEFERSLHHSLLSVLADEWRSHAEKNLGPQVFVTTHQPYLLDACLPQEVWHLEKGEDGFSKATRVSDNKLVVNLVAEELPLGGLWASRYFDSTKKAT